uniref:Uncharacterized protein n=1 Tax=Arundo donax TaxID=35708 RepID=A0A0A9FLP3_ARUDO
MLLFAPNAGLVVLIASVVDLMRSRSGKWCHGPAWSRSFRRCFCVVPVYLKSFLVVWALYPNRVGFL